MKGIKIRGSHIQYELLNPDKKETILLVHGHPFNHTMWKYQYEALKDYRLILPDLKGYGRSDFEFDKIFIEEQALDLALLLDVLETPQVHLLGLSMGGQIVVEFQRLFPARCESLIICASTPKAESTDSYNNRLRLAHEIAEIGMEEYTRNDIHKYINLEINNEDSVIYQHLFQMMSSTPDQGAIASHRGRAERRDNFNCLKNINIPALVIAGAKDYFFEVEEVRSVANAIDKAEFFLFAETGHLPNMEQPEEFNRILLGFLNRTDRASHSYRCFY